MKISKNRGMYLETVINNSIRHYEESKVALFRKQTIPIKIKKITNLEVIGLLKDKCDSDYYGVYKSKFVALEAKQTDKPYFNYDQIMKHQIDYLELITDLGGLSYLIIYFQQSESFYFLEFKTFKKIFISQNEKKRIYEKFFKKYAFRLELYFPGWIDFIKKIEV